MNVLVIGYGSAGRRHALNAKHLGHAVWVYDTSAHALARSAADAMRFSDADEWHRMQAAIVATPAGTHREVARWLETAGYRGPLLVEKPLDTSLEAASEWLSWPHPTTMVGYNLRWQSEACRMISLADVSALEKASLFLSCDMAAWPGRSYGNFLLECSHEVDLAMALGADQQVGAVHLYDEATRRAVFDIDGWCRVEISAASARYNRQWIVESVTGTRMEAQVTKPEGLGSSMYLDMLAHFMDKAAEGDITDVPFQSGLDTVRLCLQVMSGGAR